MGLFPFIGFSHAENVANRATRCVADYHHPVLQQPITNDARFSVVTALIFDLKCDAGKHNYGICKIKSAFGQGFLSLGFIERDPHFFIVYTITGVGNVCCVC